MSAHGSRRPLVVGNWKLHKTRAEARALAAGVVTRLVAAPEVGKAVDLAIAPVFTALAAAAQELTGSNIRLAAQDVYWEASGAFTGEVSAPLLRDAGCEYVIVGHSERRQLFGEQDADVRRKAVAVLGAGMHPIVCVGETLAQREGGETSAVVLGQARAAFEGLDQDAAARVVLAYEPIWAIGTGRNAQPADAQVVHAQLRATVADGFGGRVAEAMRILYGGSVKPENARSLLSQSDVDGALVGGASLDAESFFAIAAAAQ